MSRDQMRGSLCTRGRVVRQWRSFRRARRNQVEAGFTLIELLVVVAIMPLVVGAISVALLSILQNDTPVSNSLTSSGDAQVTSATYVQDVQAAKWITTDGHDLLLCGGKAGTLLLSISPDNAPSSAILNIISYVAVPNSGSTTYTVYREACTGGKGSPPPVGSTTAVAFGTVYNPAPVCPSTSSTSTVAIAPCTSTLQTAASTGWAAAFQFSGVSLRLNEPVRTGSPSGPNFSYNLTATPRPTGTGGVAPTGFTPILPVEFLGTCTLTGSKTTVTADNGATPPVAGSGFIGFSGSSNNCTGTGSLNPSNPASPPTYYNVTDPIAASGLQPPPIPTTSPPTVSCTTVSPITCPSGTYTTSLNFQGDNAGSMCSTSQGVTFNPTSNLVVFQSPVTIHKSNVTFGSGNGNVTYWFEGGLTIDTASNVCFGNATYIFGSPNGSGNGLSIDSQSSIGESNPAGGLIFYIPPGSTTAGLQSGISGNMTAFPPSASTYYDGIALWDASTGLLTLGQGNGGKSGLMAQFGGIYDPCPGNVSIAGNYQLQSQFLVACNVTVQTSQVTTTG